LLFSIESGNDRNLKAYVNLGCAHYSSLYAARIFGLKFTRKLSFLLCRVAILCLLLTTVVLCRLLWNGGTLINAFLSYAPVGRTYLIKAKEPTYFLRFILPIG